ncbi:hypothetical protein ERJ75_000065600 [Trypanosoma vivax]|uniref:Ubiquitin-like domain-containing protein n=1 Tax=Trypanosoma vivax (strain Y486) TaxID=1055687 RepID=G0TVM5_TRYVY|nr:hypothetical protein TRVL_07564 [Trypanosoma vivax]KAH8620582.1 hypothetical protein ERJ75_000065600 [Trypanosoma vivax]CCC47991.1 conserved hypothetical protein [Trypanosoma vivax Y486]
MPLHAPNYPVAGEGSAQTNATHTHHSCDDGAPNNARAHNPYAKTHSVSNGNVQQTSVSIGSEQATSVPPTNTCRLQTTEDADQLKPSRVTVHTRYRKQSTPISIKTAEGSIPTSPREGAARSASSAWSFSSSRSYDGFHRRFTCGQLQSPNSGNSQDLTIEHSRITPQHSGGYVPAGFAMPPALSPGHHPHGNALVVSPMAEDIAMRPPNIQVGSPMTSTRGGGYLPNGLFPVAPFCNGIFTLQSSNTTTPMGQPSTPAFVGSAERRSSQQTRHLLGDGASTISGSSGSSVRDDLPLCPKDDDCSLINDRQHQGRYAHTCRLFPCYHGHIARHAKLFRHSEGQIMQPGEIIGAKGSRKKLPAEALASVNFSSINKEAPNAFRIIVSHAGKSYEIFGDWENVRVHTFKRYLHQVYKLPPSLQVLVRQESGVVLDDDIQFVGHYGILPDSVIVLKWKDKLLDPSCAQVEELLIAGKSEDS